MFFRKTCDKSVLLLVSIAPHSNCNHFKFHDVKNLFDISVQFLSSQQNSIIPYNSSVEIIYFALDGYLLFQNYSLYDFRQHLVLQPKKY